MDLVGAHDTGQGTVDVIRGPGLPGVVVHLGTRIRDAFAPHFHADAHICFVLDGARRHTAGRQRHSVGAGDLLVVPPGEVHGGASPEGEGWTFAALYCTPEALARGADDLADEPGVSASPLAPQVARDGAGGRAVLALTRALQDSPLAAQTHWLSLLGHLLRGGAAPPPARRERALVRRVRAYLDEHLAESVTLDRLTALAGVSKEHLVRSFTADLGLPPHTYHLNARIERAKQRLLHGGAIAEVALSLGFHDQSHFTRHFRRIVGVPPGRFARAQRRG